VSGLPVTAAGSELLKRVFDDWIAGALMHPEKL
jgi:hypothetical protein